jgi:hypothetical protein
MSIFGKNDKSINAQLSRLIEGQQQQTTLLQRIALALSPTPAHFDIDIRPNHYHFDQPNQGEIDQMKQTNFRMALKPAPPAPGTGMRAASASKPSLAAALDFTILDNGSAEATITSIVDAAGQPSTFPTGTVPVWTVSAPALQLAPAADGMSCSVAPASPPALATGLTLTVTVTFADAAGVPVTLTATSQPIDIIAGGPAGFQISL